MQMSAVAARRQEMDLALALEVRLFGIVSSNISLTPTGLPPLGEGFFGKVRTRAFKNAYCVRA